MSELPLERKDDIPMMSLDDLLEMSQCSLLEAGDQARRFGYSPEIMGHIHRAKRYLGWIRLLAGSEGRHRHELQTKDSRVPEKTENEKVSNLVAIRPCD